MLRGRERGRSRSRRRNVNANLKVKADHDNFPDIPEEIVLEILSRLPRDSLSRFRCASKQWCSSISDISIRIGYRQKVLVLSSMRMQYSGTLYALHSIDEGGRSVEMVQCPWESSLYCEIQIFGSCNGLCLILLNADLYLWNPLNGYREKVFRYERLRYENPIACGLCYDSSTNEYKAVMALPHSSVDYGVESVVVGSFRRKHWKHVSFPYRIGTVHSGPVLNEHLHWFARRNNSNDHHIVSFDPQEDKFKRVRMPKPKHMDENILLGLGALNGCLCMVRHDHPNNHKANAEVWVMKEYGVEKSWTILFTVSSMTFHIFDELVPLCYTKNGGVLMKFCINDGGEHIIAYSPNGNSHTDVPIWTDHCSIDAVVYEESLVKPTGYNWEFEERRGVARYMEQFLLVPSRIYSQRRDGLWEYSDFY